MTSSPDWYPILLENARLLRQHPTPAERYLWAYICKGIDGVKFRRQQIIGDYIADFASVRPRLVIELDGEYHLSSEQKLADLHRTESLQRMGFRVIRFSNDELFQNINKVLDMIQETVHKLQSEPENSSSPALSLHPSQPASVSDEAPSPTRGRRGKGLIFAAGLGTRLKPLTDTMPKALVPVAGKPLIQHVAEKLADSGFDDLVVNVHHFADMLEDWVTNNQGSFPDTGKAGDRAIFSISDERKELLETGGGIKHAAPLLKDADRFLIHNVDILSNVRLGEFWKAGEGSEATLLVSQRETQRYLIFDNDMRLVGWTNIKTGEVKSPFPAVHEAFNPDYVAPVNAVTARISPWEFHFNDHAYQLLAFAGIHQMSTSLLPMMDSWPDKFSIIDFYLGICDKVVIRGYVQPDLQLIDVGKLDTLEKAEEFVIHNLNSGS